MVLCGFNEVRASTTSDVCIKIVLMVSVGGGSWSIECLENTIGTSCKYRVEIVWNFLAFSLPVVIVGIKMHTGSYFFGFGYTAQIAVDLG